MPTHRDNSSDAARTRSGAGVNQGGGCLEMSVSELREHAMEAAVTRKPMTCEQAP